ncbi:hypothetical protein [Lentzea sp. HUAS12]|uniref:hypothetical protein n=1 Tax=Lentzea sp. HUAS12 TaxID=2951806 RepID=UPI0020A1D7AA|nr:hypothetical protein [Lentzea sp. HUAS12]USX54108.1 hypothetical protein ND450_08410 [Lentzea sp. HUAS12]
MAKVAAAAAATVAATTMLTGTAHAGPQHHGTYPDAGSPACNQNAGLIATRGIETEYGQVVSYVDVYYSYSCQTNWIRVRGNPAGGQTLKRIWSDAVPGELVEPPDYYDQPSYTKQVYAPGATCVRFQVKLTWPDGRHYAETYTAGANHQVVC